MLKHETLGSPSQPLPRNQPLPTPMQALARASSSATFKRVVAGFSGTVTRSYRTCRGKPHVAPLSTLEPPPKGPKRVAKQERRIMIVEFVQKYRASNEGKFPSITYVRQQLGGSHYTVREIIQELECNQRKLSLDHDKAAPLQGTDEFSDHSGLNDESGTAEFAEHPPKDDNGKNPYSCDTVKSIQDVDDVLISQEHATTCTANMEKDSNSSGWGLLFPHNRGIYHSLFSRKLSHIPEQNSSCPIVIGNSKLLSDKIEAERLQTEKTLSKDLLKQKYKKNFRPQLVSKCLILPENLRGKSMEFLHHQYHLVNRITPQYLSAYELMIQRERIVDEEEWNFLWNHILSNRTFIVEDWDSNICNIETLHYDFGMKGFCKGEIDASYHDGKNGEDGKATISLIIWREDKIICSEVYRDIKCPSIHAAEAYAALALFFRCFDKGIDSLLLWTDNQDIHGAINGSFTVKHTSKIQHLLLLLGCISKRFKKLRSMFKPRELMFLANELAQDTISIPESVDMEKELKKWTYQLSGKAVFRLSLAGPANQIIKKFEIKDYKSKEQTVCFMEVDHLCKLEAIAQIKETLRPSNIHLAVDRFDEKPVDFQIRVKEMAGANLQFAVKDGCTIFNCTTKYTGGKGLLIVVDATMPKQSYGNYLDCFTIILVCPGERPSLDQSIKELSALSYVYFNGVRSGQKDEERKLKLKQGSNRK
ncbi:uncharacterized protein LOC8055742 isoform X2 [Sorghum bicolor]|uniref:AT3G52170-like helix-turn-helix domain-containing protein n=1 Tax=Sorghum bicolor TaxID=4558 RepID=A0A1B6P776_SORBI|nr:uncharacterized protein LOC8055742 isoform X2 [Sorghum bicolor]KXG21536.1 hypothetical protein SORBI_3009G078200 [Sorghum bicolor]|eukprot:XP_021303232.1 uncharacterized protein LOC8055742 isoform X2 [Sorghum bicolor]